MNHKDTNSPDFLTVDEAARLVGLSHWTIRLWLHKGVLTRYKSASRTVVSRKELLDLVQPKPAKEAK
jgi:excisionase family DNA binding protein